MYKIFISYSHDDQEFKERIVEKLNVLEIAKKCEIWHDQDIETGQEWRNEIFKQLNNSTHVIMLISESFLSSDFIKTNEIPLILELYKQGQIILIPIILSPCPWEKNRLLKNLQVLPKNGVPLMTGNENEIEYKLFEIAQTISDLLQKKFGSEWFKRSKIFLGLVILAIFLMLCYSVYLNVIAQKQIEEYYLKIKDLNQKMDSLDPYKNKPEFLFNIIKKEEDMLFGNIKLGHGEKYLKEDSFIAPVSCGDLKYSEITELQYLALLDDELLKKIDIKNKKGNKKGMDNAKMHLWKSDKEVLVKNFKGISRLFPHIYVQRVLSKDLHVMNSNFELMFANHLSIELLTLLQNKDKYSYYELGKPFIDQDTKILYFQSIAKLKNVVLESKPSELTEISIRKEVMFFQIKQKDGDSVYMIEIIIPKESLSSNDIDYTQKWLSGFHIIVAK